MKIRSTMLGVVLAAAGMMTLGCERREPAPTGGQPAQPPGQTEPAPSGTTGGGGGTGTGTTGTGTGTGGTGTGTGAGTTP